MDSLYNGNLWLIVAKLKALVMSRKTTLTKLFLSRALYHWSKQCRRKNCVEWEGPKADRRGKRRLLGLR